MYKIENFNNNENIEFLDENEIYKVIKINYKKYLICDIQKHKICVNKNIIKCIIGSNIKEIKEKKYNKIKEIVNMFLLGNTTKNIIYEGEGKIVLELKNNIIFESLKDWNNSICINNKNFLASYSDVNQKNIRQSNIFSTILSEEGSFYTKLEGESTVCIESTNPKEELIELDLKDDTFKIDGNLVVAWSGELKTSVEKVYFETEALICNALNVFEGTGKILISPQVNFGKNIN